VACSLQAWKRTDSHTASTSFYKQVGPSSRPTALAVELGGAATPGVLVLRCGYVPVFGTYTWAYCLHVAYSPKLISPKGWGSTRPVPCHCTPWYFERTAPKLFSWVRALQTAQHCGPRRLVLCCCAWHTAYTHGRQAASVTELNSASVCVASSVHGSVHGSVQCAWHRAHGRRLELILSSAQLSSGAPDSASCFSESAQSVTVPLPTPLLSTMPLLGC
jgi:hypothetical protein